MAVQTFSDLYISDCENCGDELDWEWLDDDLVFQASCSCGCSYTLEPTAGVLTTDTSCEGNEDEDEDC